MVDKETIKRRKKRKELQSKIPKEVITARTELLFYNYKDWHQPYLKYWRKNNGYLLKFVNCPMTLFVEDYIILGEDMLDDLDKHVFTKWERDIFLTSNRRKNSDGIRRIKEKKPSLSLKRLIKLVKSIKKYGYCGKKFDTYEGLINVADNYTSPYGGKGYKVLWGNHRMAVCAGFGMKEIKVNCWRY